MKHAETVLSDPGILPIYLLCADVTKTSQTWGYRYHSLVIQRQYQKVKLNVYASPLRSPPDLFNKLVYPCATCRTHGNQTLVLSVSSLPKAMEVWNIQSSYLHLWVHNIWSNMSALVGH